MINGAHIRIGRVLHEDKDFMTLELAKSDQTPLRVEDGDNFLTLIFVHQDDDGQTSSWFPWEDASS